MQSWKLIENADELEAIFARWQGPLVADVETYGRVWDRANRKLLGIAISPLHTPSPLKGIYVPINHFVNGAWHVKASPELIKVLSSTLQNRELIGYNFTYDKRFIEEVLEIKTTWVADPRIMWHLASAPSGPRPYGLKDAQKDLLGWEETNEGELEEAVKAAGGSLRKGDHYLAPLSVLAKYACLDTYSTALVYQQLKPFFEAHSYWPLLRSIMAYNELLDDNSYLGVNVNLPGLHKANKRIIAIRDGALKRFFKAVKPEIAELEQDWVDRKIATYKRDYNKTHYLTNPDKWKRFNLNSDSDKRELFYGKMDFPVVEETESGKPSTSAGAIKGNAHPAIEPYLKYEKYNTLASNFVGPYIESTFESRLHPGFNICGTVSYRLSGFKPYLLNAPFDEKLVMQNLTCDPGWVGVHADLSAIEPTITAHYSEDPSLLKVFRDGLGDIYLDLALSLFPNDKELHEGYDPHSPITKSVKERFSAQRKVAKVIQLAVQYTGTKYTVSKNLTKEGFPTSPFEADRYVRAYWQKFVAVERFNRRIRELNRRQGHLRNVIGRIIQVPDPEYKDLSNRFIQSSAHDVLMLWVLEIYKQCKLQDIPIRPILLDCHDSTSNQTPIEYADRLREVYAVSLLTVDASLQLAVSLKADIKMFKTMAGLKRDE